MPATAEQTDMKLTVGRSDLLAALDQVARVIPARAVKPVLTCVRLEAGAGLTVEATSLEHAVRVTVTACEVNRPGVALIPADKLRAIVKETPHTTLDLECDASVTGDVLTVNTRDGRFKVYGHPAGDWPMPGDTPKGDPITVKTDDLAAALGRVAIATSTESSRYAINGVLVEVVKGWATLVATDGHRMAMDRVKVEGEVASSFIVTTAGVALMVDACRRNPDTEAEIRVQGNRVRFDVDGYGYDGALVEGNFPPYRDVTPKDPSIRATVRRESFLSAVRRASVLTSDDSKGVRFAFAGESMDGLTVSSRAPESGEATITMAVEHYEGEPLEIGFNPVYLLDALKVLDTGDVTLELKAANKPLLLGADTFSYLLMPINLQ